MKLHKIGLLLFAALLAAAVTGCTAQVVPAGGDTQPVASESPMSSPSPKTAEPPSPSVTTKPLLTEADVDKSAPELTFNNRTITTFDFFVDCINLQKLEITNCTIGKNIALPEIESLKSLTVLNCGPSSVEIIRNNTQVTTLSLSGEQVTTIALLKDFHNVTNLYLSGSDVPDLSPLEGLQNLEFLSLLDGNYRITSLKPLFGLKKLSKIMMNLKTYQNIVPEDLKHYGADPDAIFPEGIIEVD